MKVKVRLNREENKFQVQETMTNDNVIPINQSSELGDSLKELNKDDIDLHSRTSDIDLRSRLHPMEVSSILALDALVAFGVCPTKCLAFTRQKKRLSVSLMGKGRQEIVEIVGGKREQDRDTGGGGFMSKMLGGFGKKDE